MSDSPIRVAIELEGIEPNDRFQAAVDELAAAAAELIEETAEVTGYVVPHTSTVESVVPHTITRVWTDMRPGVKGFNLGMPPTIDR